MKYKFNDGGRLKYGFRKRRGRDCSVRATSLAFKEDYRLVYQDLYEINKINYPRKIYPNYAQQAEKPRPSRGISRKLIIEYITNKGYSYKQTNKSIGNSYFSKGKFLILTTNHIFFLKDNTIYDTYKPINPSDKIEGYFKIN